MRLEDQHMIVNFLTLVKYILQVLKFLFCTNAMIWCPNIYKQTCICIWSFLGVFICRRFPALQIARNFDVGGN